MHKLVVIVPYRDRENHLKQFIPYITSTLQSQNITHKIIVVEQSPEKLFNRGLLCNIGVSLYKDQCDYICIHDVDIIGEDFDYRYEPNITHLSAKEKRRNYKEWYDRCMGGVVLFPIQDYIKINGFSNEYWGWGAEDDDLRLRCDIMKCDVKRKCCKYYTLDHPTMPHHKRIKNSPGYEKNLANIHTFCQNPNKQDKLLSDGLSDVDKYFTIKDTIHQNNYIFIQVLV